LSFFSSNQLEQLLQSERVNIASLFKAEFASGDFHCSEVLTGFTDNDGQFWPGLREGVLSFQDISFTKGLTAEKRVYTLDAVTAGISISLVGDQDEYRWRPISQYIQFFADDGTPVNKPALMHVGLMDKAEFSMTPGGLAKLSITTESDLVRKNGSTSGYYTAADQNARWPGDRGLERVKLLSLGETVRWPDF